MTIEQARLTAAKWWAYQIVHGGANWNNGDDSARGGMAMDLASMLQEQSSKGVTKEQETKFVEALVKQLSQHEYPECHLGVDYHPDHNLGAALSTAGINPGACPCKTITWIRKDGDGYKVVAALGYHGKQTDVTEETLAALS